MLSCGGSHIAWAIIQVYAYDTVDIFRDIANKINATRVIDTIPINLRTHLFNINDSNVVHWNDARIICGCLVFSACRTEKKYLCKH